MKYEEKLTLITIFLISFMLFKLFLKNPISKEEQKRRIERAEIYLNKYKNVDEEFFNGNFIEETFLSN
jgi:hypothetical protein